MAGRTITCPSCGNRGKAFDETSFETLGRAGQHGMPVRGCRQCGAEMTVHPSLFGAKAKLVDDPADAPPDPPAREHFHVWEYASGGSPRRTIALHDSRSEAEVFVSRHVAAFEPPVIAEGDATTGYRITSTISNNEADLGAIRIERCTQKGCVVET
jgi:hypothetical protein